LSSEYKHISEISKHFKKSFESLDKEMKQRTIEKLEEFLKGQISGDPLKGEYKGFKRIRIGKYRLIYSRPRETAYI